ncbi:STAS domain-containing protein [Streptomyces sp. CT34]|uniref:STAS domain-containing protein n=1 Tax=Streptomyces sp. CT34 TaxID=1553907 RepID=UPI0005BE337C|nr:STAS domain-containing protein [Streptomyces sp. CT34]
MSLDWQYATHRDLTVLTLTGHLGGEATARFAGAVSWVRARSAAGSILLDLTGLVSWDAEGEAAVVDAAHRLGTEDRPLVLCGTGDLPTPAFSAHQPRLIVYPDLDTALDSLTPEG